MCLHIFPPVWRGLGAEVIKKDTRNLYLLLSFFDVLYNIIVRFRFGEGGITWGFLFKCGMGERFTVHEGSVFFQGHHTKRPECACFNASADFFAFTGSPLFAKVAADRNKAGSFRARRVFSPSVISTKVLLIAP